MIEIQKNVSLKPYNTFGVAARAKFFAEIDSVEQIQWLACQTEWQSVPKLVLGGGSNMLFRHDFDGLVLKISLLGMRVLDGFLNQSKGLVVVEAAAGESWHDLVQWSLKKKLGGLENLSLIPGTVGASPVQNIGAYGVELKDVFYSLQAVEIVTGKLRTFFKEDLRFGYRDSVFKQSLKDQYIITAVQFCLTNDDHVLRSGYSGIAAELERLNLIPSIEAISQVVTQIRQKKLPDPKQIGNGGSFFKNPIITAERYEHLKGNFFDMPGYEVKSDEVSRVVEAVDEPEADGNDIFYKVPAAWLIEQCGWKGYRNGDVGVHEHQALVLVNHGHATGAAIWDLSEQIQSSVFEAFGIWLEREINVIG